MGRRRNYSCAELGHILALAMGHYVALKASPDLAARDRLHATRDYLLACGVEQAVAGRLAFGAALKCGGFKSRAQIAQVVAR